MPSKNENRASQEQANEANDDTYRDLDKQVEKSCKKDNKDRIERKCTEAQEAEKRNDTRALYGIVTEITNDRRNTSVPIEKQIRKIVDNIRKRNNR